MNAFSTTNVDTHDAHNVCGDVFSEYSRGFSLANKAKTYYSLEKVRILTKDSLHLFSKVLI